MHPLFADGIDIGFFFIAGIVVLVPLMAFEVLAEAFVLMKAWRLPFSELCSLTFFANCWSLLAGIPTKMLNAYLYSFLLPRDIPGFFARYPLAVALGSFIYFVVTVLVEGAYALRWVKRNEAPLSRKQIWRGILLANLATYIVLSPLYYYVTKPKNEVRQFSNDTRWTSHPTTAILFISRPDGYLKSIRADGSGLKTLVPYPMADYLVSSNLDLCLFRGTNGDLYFYRSDTGKTNLIWQTNERFYMTQAAFSPSGKYVAFASAKENAIQVVNLENSRRKSIPYASASDQSPLVAWSPNESTFFAFRIGASRLSITIDTNGNPVSTVLDGTNSPPTLTCFGRAATNAAFWSSGSDWGIAYGVDKCGDLNAWSEPGFGSGLQIFRSSEKPNRHVLAVAVNPGLLHIGGFWFGDVEFLEGCDECLFEANGYMYILDINGKRLGTLARGTRFIQLTSRFTKTLP